MAHNDALEAGVPAPNEAANLLPDLHAAGSATILGETLPARAFRPEQNPRDGNEYRKKTEWVSIRDAVESPATPIGEPDGRTRLE
ncbi:MAG TPA: hypothetical protein VFJ16_00500 [Longimicrobium sp.]|nr:hypothetical protein [Longimicrobium sp.]